MKKIALIALIASTIPTITFATFVKLARQMTQYLKQAVEAQFESTPALQARECWATGMADGFEEYTRCVEKSVSKTSAIETKNDTQNAASENQPNNPALLDTFTRCVNASRSLPNLYGVPQEVQKHCIKLYRGEGFTACGALSTRDEQVDCREAINNTIEAALPPR